MFNKIKKASRQYPPKLWLVEAVSFLEMIGDTILYPFSSPYITWKFEVGMTQAAAR